MGGADHYYEGSWGPIYLITYKGQMISLKLTILPGGSSSWRFQNKTYNLTSPNTSPFPPRQPCVPSCRALEKPTYDWQTTDVSATEVRTTDKQLTNDLTWVQLTWGQLTNNWRRQSWWVTDVGTTEEELTNNWRRQNSYVVKHQLLWDQYEIQQPYLSTYEVKAATGRQKPIYMKKLLEPPGSEFAS